jgi:hypothetical protein
MSKHLFLNPYVYPFVIPCATQVVEGLMSADDKTKLDGIVPGGGTVSQITIGNGLASTQSPLTTVGTMSVDQTFAFVFTSAITFQGGFVGTGAGASAFDLSGGTGIFKTPTGASTFGGSSNAFTNAITATGGIVASVNASAFDLSAGTGIFKTPTGISTFGGSANNFTAAITANSGVTGPANGSLALNATKTDGANAIGFLFNAIPVLQNGSSSLFSFQNNGAVILNLNDDGTVALLSTTRTYLALETSAGSSASVTITGNDNANLHAFGSLVQAKTNIVNISSPEIFISGMLNNNVGAVLSISANAIAITSNIHHVGAGLLKTITVPATITAGAVIHIIPDVAFTYDASGNIVLPIGGGVAVVNRTMDFTYDGAKWTPSY